MTTILPEYLRVQAQLRDDHVAVLMGSERLTYGELDAASNRLARLLIEAGCRRGDRICLFLPKSPDAIVAMFGVLKADCVYVPIDLSSPAARVQKIVDAVEPRLLLAAAPARRLLDEVLADDGRRLQVSIGTIDDEGLSGLRFRTDFAGADLSRYSAEPREQSSGSGDAAHILFTSGSTGAPKGVVITHSNVIHFVEWARGYFGLDSTDDISGHPPLHFDLSTFDIYGTLSAGARLHLVRPEQSLLPHKLADFIRSSRLTQWFSVPSALTYMAKSDVVRQDDFPHLKRLLWCGEAIPTSTLMYWMKRVPHATFTNLYGPTEATIASSYYTVPECPATELADIPIGTPCPGEELLVLDGDLRPVQSGTIGDLYIGGVGLSPGYWRDEDKTRVAFLKDPRSADETRRIYRTGDLARVGTDGLTYFHGRSDSQIKSRGYRIELGEIETALSAIDGLRESAVVAVQGDSFQGASICCAYATDAAMRPTQLRDRLSKSLPHYMLPSRWMLLDALPKNPNQKIDRPRLRELFEQQEA